MSPAWIASASAQRASLPWPTLRRGRKRQSRRRATGQSSAATTVGAMCCRLDTAGRRLAMWTSRASGSGGSRRPEPSSFVSAPLTDFTIGAANAAGHRIAYRSATHNGSLR